MTTKHPLTSGLPIWRLDEYVINFTSLLSDISIRRIKPRL